MIDLASHINLLGQQHKQLRFSVCQGRGWITSDSEATIRTLCEMYNHRQAIAQGLRLLAERGNDHD